MNSEYNKGDKVKINFGKAGKLKAKIVNTKVDSFNNVTCDCLLIISKKIKNEYAVTQLNDIKGFFIEKI